MYYCDADFVSKAGRVPELDEIATKFLSAAADARDALLKEASVLAQAAGSTAQHYIKVMQKLASGSEEYLEKETNRCVCLISALVQ